MSPEKIQRVSSLIYEKLGQQIDDEVYFSNYTFKTTFDKKFPSNLILDLVNYLEDTVWFVTSEDADEDLMATRAVVWINIIRCLIIASDILFDRLKNANKILHFGNIEFIIDKNSQATIDYAIKTRGASKYLKQAPNGDLCPVRAVLGLGVKDYYSKTYNNCWLDIYLPNFLNKYPFENHQSLLDYNLSVGYTEGQSQAINPYALNFSTTKKLDEYLDFFAKAIEKAGYKR